MKKRMVLIALTLTLLLTFAYGGTALAQGTDITPATATNQVGTSHTVTVTVIHPVFGPVQDATVIFCIISGPNASPICAKTLTNAAGQATFTYTSNGVPGTDTIQAQINSNLVQGVLYAYKTWVVSTENNQGQNNNNQGNDNSQD